MCDVSGGIKDEIDHASWLASAVLARYPAGKTESHVISASPPPHLTEDMCTGHLLDNATRCRTAPFATIKSLNISTYTLLPNTGPRFPPRYIHRGIIPRFILNIHERWHPVRRDMQQTLQH
jgi:hypothetical protein